MPLEPQLALCAFGVQPREDESGSRLIEHGLLWFVHLGAEPDPVSADRCREVFFLAHGPPFSQFAEPPQQRGGRWSWRVPREEDVRGSAPERGILPGLRCSGSRIEIDVEPAAGLARVDWTI